MIKQKTDFHKIQQADLLEFGFNSDQMDYIGTQGLLDLYVDDIITTLQAMHDPHDAIPLLQLFKLVTDDELEMRYNLFHKVDGITFKDETQIRFIYNNTAELICILYTGISGKVTKKSGVMLYPAGKATSPLVNPTLPLEDESPLWGFTYNPERGVIVKTRSRVKDFAKLPVILKVGNYRPIITTEISDIEVDGNMFIKFGLDFIGNELNKRKYGKILIKDILEDEVLRDYPSYIGELIKQTVKSSMTDVECYYKDDKDKFSGTLYTDGIIRNVVRDPNGLVRALNFANTGKTSTAYMYDENKNLIAQWHYTHGGNLEYITNISYYQDGTFHAIYTKAMSPTTKSISGDSGHGC